MATTSGGGITAQICASLHAQLGALFECQPDGERVQIRTPFIFPDGDLVDLYWQKTTQGQIVSDLGDTCGWLFVNGAYQELTAKQSQAYDEACSIYGVERRDGLLLAHITDGNLANAVARLAQAITMISHTLDIGQQAVPTSQGTAHPVRVLLDPDGAVPTSQGTAASNKRLTETRIVKAIRKHDWEFSRNVKREGQRHSSWDVDFVVRTPQREAVLMALYRREHRGWQRRAIEHAFTVFSDLAPVLERQIVPSKAISVIDDTDVKWDYEPVEILTGVSKVVRLSEPEELPAAIIGEER